MDMISRLVHFLVIWVVAVGSAHAEFRVCNDSFEVLNISIAEPYNENYRSRGWWRIAPDQCAAVIKEPLDQRYIYVYAADVFGRSAVGGGQSFCIAPRRFVIDGAEDCLLRGYAEGFFNEIDTGDEVDWTLHIMPRPD